MRDNAPRSRDSTSRGRGISGVLETSRTTRVNSGRCERKRTVRKAHAAWACSYNNLDRGDCATSKALTCSIAWLDQEWWRRHSPMRTLRARP